MKVTKNVMVAGSRNVIWFSIAGRREEHKMLRRHAPAL